MQYQKKNPITTSRILTLPTNSLSSPAVKNDKYTICLYAVVSLYVLVWVYMDPDITNPQTIAATIMITNTFNPLLCVSFFLLIPAWIHLFDCRMDERRFLWRVHRVICIMRKFLTFSNKSRVFSVFIICVFGLWALIKWRYLFTWQLVSTNMYIRTHVYAHKHVCVHKYMY